MYIVYVASLMFAGGFLLWACTFGVRGLLRENSTPLKQPGDSPEGGDVEGDTPPTAASAPSAGSVVRCRRTLMFGVLGPNISVGPRSAA